MKKLDAKLFKGNVVPSDKLNYFMGGQTVGTGYKGEADVDKVNCATNNDNGADTTYSAGDSDRDSSWYGNGCGGIEGGGGTLTPIGGISIGSDV